MDSGQHRRLSPSELMLPGGSGQEGCPRMHREVEGVAEVLTDHAIGQWSYGIRPTAKGKMIGSQAHRRWCMERGEKDPAIEIGLG
jgi:hypothetical protein